VAAGNGIPAAAFPLGFGVGVLDMFGVGVLDVLGVGVLDVLGVGVLDVRGVGVLDVPGAGVLEVPGAGVLEVPGAGVLEVRGAGVAVAPGIGASVVVVPPQLASATATMHGSTMRSERVWLRIVIVGLTSSVAQDRVDIHAGRKWIGRHLDIHGYRACRSDVGFGIHERAAGKRVDVIRRPAR